MKKEHVAKIPMTDYLELIALEKYKGVIEINKDSEQHKAIWEAVFRSIPNPGNKQRSDISIFIKID